MILALVFRDLAAVLFRGLTSPVFDEVENSGTILRPPAAREPANLRTKIDNARCVALILRTCQRRTTTGSSGWLIPARPAGPWWTAGPPGSSRSGRTSS